MKSLPSRPQTQSAEDGSLCDYKMRIYSQIKNPSEPLPPAEQNRQSQFSFHQSNSDLPRSQISEGSSRQHKNKFSFRLQPELYFQRNNPQKDKLYQVESHIRLASSSSESSPRQHSQQIKRAVSRKKIFDESMRITVLNEEGEKVQQVQPDVPLPPEIREPEQPVMRKAEQEQKRLVGILKKKTQPQQPVSMASNSSFQQSRERSRRNINRVQFVHEDTDKYLTQPILHEPNGPRIQQPGKRHQQTASIPSIGHASIVERIDRNERSIMELQERLNRKITDDERRNNQIMQMLSENAQRGQKEQERQKYEQEMAKSAHHKEIERERINLQIQQSKRLQQLILENRHLCAKVLQQSQRAPPPPTPEELHIEQRIRELQSMRQKLQLNHSLNQSQSLHLNETIITARPLEVPAHLAATLKPDWRQPQVGYSALSPKPDPPSPNLPTFQMIPERDVPVGEANKPVRRVVVVSKIY